MPEPTIDEMIDWLWRLDNASSGVFKPEESLTLAIRTILEQHEKLCATADRIKLDAIHAFVERVEKRKQKQFQQWAAEGYGDVDDGDIVAAHLNAVEAELAAMEGEANG